MACSLTTAGLSVRCGDRFRHTFIDWFSALYSSLYDAICYIIVPAFASTGTRLVILICQAEFNFSGDVLQL